MASQVPHPPPRPYLLDRLLGAVLSKRGQASAEDGFPSSLDSFSFVLSHAALSMPSVQERERSQERYRLVRVKQVLPDGSLYEGQIATAGPHGVVSSPSAWPRPPYGAGLFRTAICLSHGLLSSRIPAPLSKCALINLFLQCPATVVCPASHVSYLSTVPAGLGPRSAHRIKHGPPLDAHSAGSYCLG
jgi:hypothetical protein